MKKSITKTASSEETEAFGSKIAQQLLGQKVFLFGDLGVGKTTFLRGLARGLTIQSRIKSPTFVGEHIHKISDTMLLIHLDLYRHEFLAVEEIERLQELFGSDDMVVVEWSEMLPSELLPRKRVELKFRELDGGVREIEMKDI
jgi:tRNA threonylcarbamoyladenosine biosynthesis protein TsaE